MAGEVDRQTLSELALRSYNAVTGTVGKQGDGLTVLSGCEGSLESLILVVADLSDILLGNELLFSFLGGNPLVVGRCILREGLTLHNESLLRSSSHGSLGTCIKDDVASHRASLEHQLEAVLGIAARGEYLNITVDHALTLHRHADGRIACVAADVEGEAACGVGIDGRSVDDNVAVVIRQRVS